MRQLLIAANLVALILVGIYGVVEFAAPTIAVYRWREPYKDLMFKCDQVMREHFIAKRTVELAPDEHAVKNLEAAEVGLLDCHDYDRLRKRMLSWGVTPNQLSAVGLEALEEKKYELRDFVNIHEIRY